MKVLFLTKYDSLAANTRYRCLQFMPYLNSAGMECEVSPLLNDSYLKHKFRTGQVNLFTVISAFLKRFVKLFQLKKYDVVVLHYELFPYLPPFFEEILDFFKINYIYDFDDAIFHQYDQHPNPFIRYLLSRKIRSVIRHSKCVLAGNKYLANYAKYSSPNIKIIPTVVNPDYYRLGRKEYPMKTVSTDRPFTIGWIGAPSTVVYIREIENALRLFCLNHNARVVLVGSGPIELPGVPLTIVDWNEHTELDELKSFDVGIMPLRNDSWSRGKCGFKLLQYMACGLPVIASPVGVNKEIVSEGVSGFLPETDEQWVSALSKLYEDPTLRSEMGEQGLTKVSRDYSIVKYGPQVADIFKETISRFNVPIHFGNIDLKVTESFGEEWAAFPQNQLSREQLENIYNEYFDIFPWNKLPADGGVGADIGCGSGRWAVFVAPKVKKLYCMDASRKALDIAVENLKDKSNVEFVHASVGELPITDESLDFAYSVGVLHHIPNTQEGIKAIAKKLKPGAPFLVYIYYALENRGNLYKFLWKASDLFRKVISHLPFGMKYFASQVVAICVYWPLARTAKLLRLLGLHPRSWTLSYYKDKPFYVMRTDALDRFGTRLEKRYTREQIEKMLIEAGFENIVFSPHAPYWVGVGTKKK